MTETSQGQKRRVPASAQGMRLDRWLHSLFPSVSFNGWSRLMRKGQVRLDGKRIKGNERLQGGEEVRVPPMGVLDAMGPPEKVPAKKEVGMTDEIQRFFATAILHETPSYLALNKPAGLAVQGGTKTFKHLDGFLQAYGTKTGITYRLVHRLDRDTSGVILVAKTEEAARELARAFQQHRIHKFYVAITVKVPSPRSGTIKKPLSKMTEEGHSHEKMHVVAHGDPAATLYEVLENAGTKAALVGLSPLTGRTHQLRAHMHSIKTPILGDGKYGGADAHLPGFPKMVHLHAMAIAVPEGQKYRIIEAPLSSHMKESAERLGLEIRGIKDTMHAFFEKGG